MQRRLQADLAGSSHAEGVRVATGSMVVDDGASLQVHHRDEGKSDAGLCCLLTS